MSLTVIAFEGPIGVGKTTLGRFVAKELGIGFLDGDDCSEPGPWLRSVLRTGRRIIASCEKQLVYYPAVIIAYPLRCKDWFFYRESFRRAGIRMYCIGLTAELDEIAARGRTLTPAELRRAAQMLGEGYGSRPFSDLIIRTEEQSFELTCDRLAKDVRALLSSLSA